MKKTPSFYCKPQYEVPIHNPPQLRIPWSFAERISTEQRGTRCHRDAVPSQHETLMAMLWNETKKAPVAINKNHVAENDVCARSLASLL